MGTEKYEWGAETDLILRQQWDPPSTLDEAVHIVRTIYSRSLSSHSLRGLPEPTFLSPVGQWTAGKHVTVPRVKPHPPDVDIAV